MFSVGSSTQRTDLTSPLSPKPLNGCLRSDSPGLLPTPSICLAVQRRSFEIRDCNLRVEISSKSSMLLPPSTSIPRTSSTPSNFSENVELAKSDRYQPKHSLVNISVGLKKPQVHMTASQISKEESTQSCVNISAVYLYNFVCLSSKNINKKHFQPLSKKFIARQRFLTRSHSFHFLDQMQARQLYQPNQMFPCPRIGTNLNWQKKTSAKTFQNIWSV